MSESKNRKNEIKLIKSGKAFAINPNFDDFDNAGLIILKAAELKFNERGNDCFDYHMTRWVDTPMTETTSKEEFIQIVGQTKIFGDAIKANRIKNAIIELLDGYSMNFMIGSLSKAPRQNGRITSQTEFDYSFKSYFSPMHRQDICLENHFKNVG